MKSLLRNVIKVSKYKDYYGEKKQARLCLFGKEVLSWEIRSKK